MKPVSRFAPSPTGPLHLGHAYSALLAHDFARSRDGTFLLRIEDIDPGRARPEHVDAILADLLWLGLEWDGEIAYQSERLGLYADALERLREQHLIYPCFCTRAEISAEIAASALAPHQGEQARLYPRTCRRLGAAERERRMQQQSHAWRLDMARAIACTGPLTWRDHGRERKAEPEKFGDVVLARKDAPASYHLAVTVDDAMQGITDVVRGCDLIDCTHVHRLLQALLGLPVPAWHHHALVTDGLGKRLAKRHGAPTLAALRAKGTEPEELKARLRTGEFVGESRSEPA
ncbi:MAG: tRNA glutamyl-Q(34) synthetase GluQRS [Sphingosinicella sp.]